MARFSEAEKTLIWDWWQQSGSMRGVARELGRSSSSVRTMIESRGGVRPVSRCRNVRHLSLEECEEISRGMVRAEALGVAAGHVTVRIKDRTLSPDSLPIQPGLRVCFTGAATTSDGSPLQRQLLERIAQDLGFEPVDRLTKTGCDLLVAADPSSQSGKARKSPGLRRTYLLSR